MNETKQDPCLKVIEEHKAERARIAKSRELEVAALNQGNSYLQLEVARLKMEVASLQDAELKARSLQKELDTIRNSKPEPK